MDGAPALTFFFITALRLMRDLPFMAEGATRTLLLLFLNGISMRLILSCLGFKSTSWKFSMMELAATPLELEISKTISFSVICPDSCHVVFLVCISMALSTVIPAEAFMDGPGTLCLPPFMLIRNSGTSDLNPDGGWAIELRLFMFMELMFFKPSKLITFFADICGAGAREEVGMLVGALETFLATSPVTVENFCVFETED